MNDAKRLQIMVLSGIFSCLSVACSQGATAVAPDTASAEVATTDAIEPNDSIASPLTAGTVRAAYIDARCGAFDTCAQSPSWFSAVAGCAASFVADAPFGSRLHLAQAGRVKFAPDKAAACLAAAKDCALLGSYPDICHAVFSGLPKGAKCQDHDACDSGRCQGY